jgi:hypothetical protein
MVPYRDTDFFALGIFKGAEINGTGCFKSWRVQPACEVLYNATAVCD